MYKWPGFTRTHGRKNVPRGQDSTPLRARSLTGLMRAPLPGSEACGASSAGKQGFGLPVSSRASVSREGASLS